MIGLSYLFFACLWFFISVVAGIVTYQIVLYRGKKRLASTLLGAFVFVSMLVGLPVTVQAADYVLTGQWRTYDVDDVVGQWTATFNRYGCWQFMGKETLTIHGDGTYTQKFADEEGNEEQVAQNKWSWQTERQIILQEAKSLPYGFESICDDRSPDKLAVLANQAGNRSIRRIVMALRAPGQLILESAPAGDPDAPQITRFYRDEKK